ncbi:MAG: AAA family ATPase [Deltaproteobacteria bacterium]|nr:AAA family ATPase [Deltaproteobacteria bacterium]
MYRAHFRLEENPFSLTPDPRYLFLSERHREALAHLFYGLGQGGGFVQLTGEVGTGKTTLCRSLLEQAPSEVDVALVLNPRQSASELLATICDELGVEYGADRSIKSLVDVLNRHLLATHAAGRRTVVIIDEAQQLQPDVLEQVRLLTNLETATDKLLKIILIGQPELRDMMARSGLRQLAQRITARYHLAPLSARETATYVRHRLEVAGCSRPIFSPAALRAVHRRSGGVPRLINVICDRALLGAYARDRERVNRWFVGKAAREVLGETRRLGGRRWVPWAIGLALLALGATALLGGPGALWAKVFPRSSAAGIPASTPAARALVE